MAFLQRAAAALKPGGMLFVKENVCDKGFIVDSSDASVTRHASHWAWLPLRCAAQTMQGLGDHVLLAAAARVPLIER